MADLALQRALDGTVLRHRAIAENLANVDTPGYKRLEVEFSAALKAALAAGERNDEPLARTDRRHLPGTGGGPVGAEPAVFRVRETTGRADGNNVDPDAELARLAENTLLYNALTQVLGRRLAMQRFVLSEGRR
ncbi:MAG TPA: flagellar basal body rod protein FlgB [Firmicutes bacterium]|nr:flagellar basal body rod protein FlgB [Bacillota bacterium]